MRHHVFATTTVPKPRRCSGVSLHNEGSDSALFQLSQSSAKNNDNYVVHFEASHESHTGWLVTKTRRKHQQPVLQSRWHAVKTWYQEKRCLHKHPWGTYPPPLFHFPFIHVILEASFRRPRRRNEIRSKQTNKWKRSLRLSIFWSVSFVLNSRVSGCIV